MSPHAQDQLGPACPDRSGLVYEGLSTEHLPMLATKPNLSSVARDFGQVQAIFVISHAGRNTQHVLFADPTLGQGNLLPTGNQDTLPHGGFGNLIALPLQVLLSNSVIFL